ncbi:H-NS histone family protein [Comamonas sp. CMM01]|uniref:H-NS histone family protein n=1 Tax=Comamonas sp. CMM01 TaxID=2769280 RepID=UPI001781EF56|nr:H-NS histone family protein [Comamonas sp. CMM01]MBD9530432.1 H-NS histone family protein [Comamonas sp. CMM01]
MSTYQILLQQKAELEAQIAEVHKREKSAAVTQARELVAQFGLNADDVFGGKKEATSGRATVAPKYRDPATGATWTGRGKPPKWINGQDRAAFAI